MMNHGVTEGSKAQILRGSGSDKAVQYNWIDSVCFLPISHPSKLDDE